MSSALEYVILGRDKDPEGRTRRKLLLFNGALPAFDPAYFARLVDLSPMPLEAGAPQPALTLVDYDDERMLMALSQPGEGEACTQHFVFMPRDAMAQSADQFERWLALLPAASADINMTLPSLLPPAFSAIGVAERAAHLEAALAQMPDDSFEHALALLGGAVDEKPLAIRNFPRDFTRRLALVAGMQALLPGWLAGRLSFATHAPIRCQTTPQLIFAEAETEDAWNVDWGEPALADFPDHPYLAVLRALQRDDLAAFAAEIGAWRPPTPAAHGDLAESLRQVAERFWIDRQVRAQDDIDTADIIRIVDGAAPPRDDLHRSYFKTLLENALSNRDAVAGRRVAEEMDRNAGLERALANLLDQSLEEQPDAVYVFIRNRLIHLGLSESWLERLQSAARNSLEVAVQDGDAGTVVGWLELIAREPSAYKLGDVLREGVLAARRRAWNDGELGIHLILIAARRLPDIVDRLYADDRLIAALEGKARRALDSPSVESLTPLLDDKAEYFLLALYHGLQVSDSTLVTVAVARRLWELAESDAPVDLPAAYRAPAVIRLLATERSRQMTDEALDLLFRQIVARDDRQLILDAARHLAPRGKLFPRLQNALGRDGIEVDQAFAIMNAVGGLDSADPQDLIEAWLALLDFYQWEPGAQRLMESLSRLLAKNPEAPVSYRHLWTLFGSCQGLGVEGAARVAAMRLLTRYADEDDLSELVAGLARICREVHASKTLREAVNNWWRDYAQGCNLAQLQRLERELDKQRQLEPQKQILKTALAMRRWTHHRDPVQFTEMIDIATTFIEHISEAFDDAQLSEIDGRTIRREIDALALDLSSEQRHILANNLRHLAARVIHMAERRSKPSLIRSDESIEQQLLHGEANPQGSVDMLKWIAGYLDGAHPQREG